MVAQSALVGQRIGAVLVSVRAYEAHIQLVWTSFEGAGLSYGRAYI